MSFRGEYDVATRKTAAPTVATPKKAPRRERTRLAAKVDWRPAFAVRGLRGLTRAPAKLNLRSG